MKKIILIQVISIALMSCNKDDDINDYKQEMRDFVIGISQYAKSVHPGFFVIPQNGIELVNENGDENGDPDSAYLAAIDGNGQEDLFYGYNDDDHATPANENSYLRAFLDISRNSGNPIFVTDYCSSHANIDNSYLKKILDADFDGVYLDIIDAFEYYE
jgi:cysteinyl-tRNA synthetase